MKKRLRKKLWRKAARILAYRASIGDGGLARLIRECQAIPPEQEPTYENFVRAVNSMYRVQ